MKADKKADLIKSIRSTWSSLDSHLDWIVEPIKDKKFAKIHGGRKFHKKTAIEYAETILTLTKLL
jgi:hypothetical protein